MPERRRESRRRIAPLRSLAFGALGASALTLAPAIATAQTTIRLTPGESRTLTLKETPSTGYTWALDAAASRGLDVVSVDDLGHRAGYGPPGAPGERSWAIRAQRPGHAALVFVYRRPWEPAPVKTERVAVDVAH
jgi:inhibitor of cysteine peptidase